MKISAILGTNKLFYILIGVVAFVVLITVIFIVGSVKGGKTSGGTTSLEFWGVFDTRQDFAGVIGGFQKVESGTRINYKQFSYEDYEKALVDGLVAGTGPDVLLI